VRKKMIKNSQPFGKKFQKTVGGGFFFDSHCMMLTQALLYTLLFVLTFILKFWCFDVDLHLHDNVCWLFFTTCHFHASELDHWERACRFMTESRSSISVYGLSFSLVNPVAFLIHMVMQSLSCVATFFRTTEQA